MKRLFVLVLILLTASAAAYAQFTFTSLDYPGGTLTTARGINDRGDIVGAYRVVPPRHALLIRRGTFIPLASTTILGTDLSEAYKSNDRGGVVGIYSDDNGFTHGFLLSQGVVTTLDFPGASDTYAFGINESGTIVGQWDLLDAGGNPIVYHGFLWKNGAFSEVNFPGAADTFPYGINIRGDFVGSWDSGLTSPITHGFVYTNGEFVSFDVPVPGATLTQPNDINAQGQIVGEWFDSNGGVHGFLLVGAAFTSIDYPGAAITSAWGINSAGQIVGNHYDDAGAPARGYLAQPGDTKPQ